MVIFSLVSRSDCNVRRARFCRDYAIDTETEVELSGSGSSSSKRAEAPVTYQIFCIVQYRLQGLSQLAHIRRLILDILNFLLLALPSFERIFRAALADQARRSRLEQDPISLVFGSIMFGRQGRSSPALMSRLSV